VQTFSFLAAPPATARTGCKLTFQRRLVTLRAWLMRFPKRGPRPRISRTLAMGGSSSRYDANLQFSSREAGGANGV
jgi:hypothetical protein